MNWLKLFPLKPKPLARNTEGQFVSAYRIAVRKKAAAMRRDLGLPEAEALHER